MSRNNNMEDPGLQEKIRRGPHEYVAGDGKHGTYKPKIYVHEEYPKIMLRAPTPNRKSYKTDEEYQVVLKAHDDESIRSIVKNKVEEEAWLKANPNPVTEISVAIYPKTMDKTPSPRALEFATLEEFRAAKKEWEELVTASIVHDKEEEELWKREHSKDKKKTA